MGQGTEQVLALAPYVAFVLVAGACGAIEFRDGYRGWREARTERMHRRPARRADRTTGQHA